MLSKHVLSSLSSPVFTVAILNPSEGLREFAKENELITNNRIKNIYLLSERGYSKLLKNLV